MRCSDSLDFSTIMATTIHDVKNTLNLLSQSIETIASRQIERPLQEQDELTELSYQTARMNATLVQLLTLYQAQSEQQRLPIHKENIFIVDLLDDVYAHYQWLAFRRRVTISIEVDRDLTWICDQQLITFILNDALVNALRFCQKKIQITASVVDTLLRVSINDDGEGFSDEILVLASQQLSSTQWRHRKHGLGLYFAKVVANAHNNGAHHGYVSLSNQGNLCGGEFVLHLP
ncbi:sensor histidine kinase [Celerinatantimonas yamalensis]|uniref:HAMP domain-containing sensor histidine kinase n=1 Tax=Celerinatantimonas yamalensis TaxID=559956 RepID=A0ABW9G316_9GAMM